MQTDSLNPSSAYLLNRGVSGLLLLEKPGYLNDAKNGRKNGCCIYSHAKHTLDPISANCCIISQPSTFKISPNLMLQKSRNGDRLYLCRIQHRRRGDSPNLLMMRRQMLHPNITTSQHPSTSMSAQFTSHNSSPNCTQRTEKSCHLPCIFNGPAVSKNV
jgi:hypothetical protein